VTRQLPLNIDFRPSASFSTFFAGSNAEAVSSVQALASGHGEHYLYLWGRAGVGKTHLLQAACQELRSAQRGVAYVPLTEARELSPELLDGLEQTALICLDDLQAVSGNGAWELAIFSLFNRCRDAASNLLVSASQSLAQLPLCLADLQSRLAWGPTYHLMALTDAELPDALGELARHRGLELPAETVEYLLRRCPRDLRTLQELLEHLDRSSLAAQSRLTVPFVRNALQTLAQRPECPADRATG